MSASAGGTGRIGIDAGPLAEALSRRLAQLATDRFGPRLARRDPGLFPERHRRAVAERLGWIDLPREASRELPALMDLAQEAAREEMRDVLLLGMGGSSLAPEVFASTFPAVEGRPRLRVLDSTHPDAVRAAGEALDPAHTLCIVASKSGTTLETLSLYRWFWEQVPAERRGRHFVAITDPGSSLEQLARERRFRAVLHGRPDVGGRFSALSVFGLAPAALVGVDVGRLLERARDLDAAFADGLRLGAFLGEAALAGRDKVTFLVSPTLAAFPAWAEQLLAESTGKEGRGVVPVGGEPLLDPAAYGPDRVFVHLAVRGEPDTGIAAATEARARAGHPVALVLLPDVLDLGGEMLRFEIATAALGAILGVNPFDQPDVELAKQRAKEAMAAGDDAAAEPGSHAPDDVAAVEDFLSAAAPGRYVALQAFLAPTPDTARALRDLREAFGRRTGLATTADFGPRFLHSTGQLHKGGPETALCVQLVDRPARDVRVPETDHTFGRLVRAQAIGDYRALEERGRRVLRVDVGPDAPEGLRRLAATVAPPTRT